MDDFWRNYGVCLTAQQTSFLSFAFFLFFVAEAAALVVVL
jgi:hypothetical protein